jgi:phenylalanine ammonia-lyase
MPLSYIVGAIEGNLDIYGELEDGRVITTDKALPLVGLKPVTLSPTDRLGLVNGTACSAAVASLVVYETHQLAVLAQALTAMAVEVRSRCSTQGHPANFLQALNSTADSFNPFIANNRPHMGQIECAKNIYHFLQGSELAEDLRGENPYTHDDLGQDRYALRTASQWTDRISKIYFLWINKSPSNSTLATTLRW